jgi:HTH-type transcriptional regulator, glycine betaine synthesis regulator
MTDPPSAPLPSSPSSPSLSRPRSLSPGEIAVSDVIGRLIEFWGFKRNMGRIWSVLYLSADPLSAEDLRGLLRLSSGAVSMTLSELSRWGVVRKVWVQGERKDFFVAEVQLWKMISRVFNEREKIEIVSAVEAFEQALCGLESVAAHAKDEKTKARAELQRERIRQLLELAKLGQSLLDALLSTAKLDAGPLVRLLLGARASDASRQDPPRSS